VSRRVAHQAADCAGIGVETMQQILPLYAGILAGSFSQWMAAQSQAFTSFTSAAGSETPKPEASNPWADLWSGWMKAAQSGQKPAVNPLQEMMTSFLQAASPEKPPEQTPSSPPSSWGEMMEKGREMQMQYLTSLQSIFDDAWKAGSRKA